MEDTFREIFFGGKKLIVKSITDQGKAKYKEAVKQIKAGNKDSKISLTIDLNTDTENLVIENYTDGELLRLGLIVGGLK